MFHMNLMDVVSLYGGLPITVLVYDVVCCFKAAFSFRIDQLDMWQQIIQGQVDGQLHHETIYGSPYIYIYIYIQIYIYVYTHIYMIYIRIYMEIYTGTDVSSKTVSGNATQIINVIGCDMTIHMRTNYKPTEPRKSSEYAWRKRSR
jgi:hypothetical protein